MDHYLRFEFCHFPYPGFCACDVPDRLRDEDKNSKKQVQKKFTKRTKELDVGKLRINFSFLKDNLEGFNNLKSSEDFLELSGLISVGT